MLPDTFPIVKGNYEGPFDMPAGLHIGLRYREVAEEEESPCLMPMQINRVGKYLRNRTDWRY